MNRQAARLEQLLIELAQHIAKGPASVRLVYDDHHAGNRLALAAQGSGGLCEVQIWREVDSKLQPRMHVLADGSAAASLLGDWLESWKDTLPWRARGTQRFAERLQGMARSLAESFEGRGQGYPTQARIALEAGLGPARPMAGVTGPLKGNQQEPLAVVAGGQHATLWGAAVAATEDAEASGVPERALIWDPGARAFIAPRELRARLCQRMPLPELTQQWPRWCLAPPAPQIIEQQIAEIDYRARAEGPREGCGDLGLDCFDCVILSDLMCLPVDCGLLELECGLFECGVFEGFDCGLLECGDCGALDLFSCGG